MLAYAARNRPAARTGSPKALVLIVAGHAVLIGAVMTAKMELAPGGIPFIPKIINIPIEPPPPEPQPKVEPQPKKLIPQPSFIEAPPKVVDMGQTSPTTVATGPTIAEILPVSGGGDAVVLDPPKHDPVRIAARFNTPDSALRPPYPLDMRRAEEEATLKLRLTIDTRGRITAVEPVGAANPSFLEAARRHIIRAWRYKPATEDGVAVPSSTVITLSFRLEDV